MFGPAMQVQRLHNVAGHVAWVQDCLPQHSHKRRHRVTKAEEEHGKHGDRPRAAECNSYEAQEEPEGARQVGDLM